jgi:hypothetical protein
VHETNGDTEVSASIAGQSKYELLIRTYRKSGLVEVPNDVSNDNLLEWCKANNPFPIAITEEPYATREDRHKAKVALRRAAAHDLRSKLQGQFRR